MKIYSKTTSYTKKILRGLKIDFKSFKKDTNVVGIKIKKGY